MATGATSALPEEAPLDRRSSVTSSTSISSFTSITSTFEPGDHLWKRGGRCGGRLYDHHLIYVRGLEHGGHAIIENSFRAGRIVEKVIEESALKAFSIYERPDEPLICLARAKEDVGKRYNLCWNNCETFANRCVHGSGKSRQVRMACCNTVLCAGTSGGGATAASVGFVTHYERHYTVTMPSKAYHGLAAWLGYTKKKTVVIAVSQTHPVGIAAASGAACACGIWTCLTLFFRRDPRKKRESATQWTKDKRPASPAKENGIAHTCNTQDISEVRPLVSTGPPAGEPASTEGYLPQACTESEIRVTQLTPVACRDPEYPEQTVQPQPLLPTPPPPGAGPTKRRRPPLSVPQPVLKAAAKPAARTGGGFAVLPKPKARTRAKAQAKGKAMDKVA